LTLFIEINDKLQREEDLTCWYINYVYFNEFFSIFIFHINKGKNYIYSYQVLWFQNQNKPWYKPVMKVTLITGNR